MAIAEERSTIRWSSKRRGPSENALLAILTCAFLLFNILFGMTAHRALPNQPGGQRSEVIVSHGD